MISELPSFLTQTGPNAFTLTLSASAVETFMLCPAKYAWSRVTGIEAASPRAGMNYGKGMHLLLAALYKEALDCSVIAPEDILEKHFAANPQPLEGARGKPEWRTQARALQAFAAYREAYPAETFEVLGVEEPFEVELGRFDFEVPPTGEGDYHSNVNVTVRFRGIRDLRVRWHQQIWVLDHKTMKQWGDLVISEGKSSFQFLGYAWVERLLAQRQIALADNPDVVSGSALPPHAGLPVGGVIGNYIIAREPYAEGRKPTPRDLPRDQFERVPYPFSDAQLDEWHSRAMGIARDLWRRWSESDWPQHSTACAHWGLCEYYRLCWETDPDYRLAAALGADFRPRTPSPFEEEAGEERE